MLKRVMLIEDDLDAAFMLQQNLSRAGYDVDCLNEGNLIVERRFPLPDIFILDNGLPTINGIALCKYLKLQPDLKDIPILVISANYDIRDKAYNAGATAFLNKPFAIQEILNCLRTLK
ncbi:MAG TPA: response regulator [Chryseosolibacter sp.]